MFHGNKTDLGLAGGRGRRRRRGRSGGGSAAGATRSARLELAELLVLALVLVGELLKRVDDHAGIGTVEDVDGRRPHPRLQVVDRQRNVLCVAAVEHPDLAVGLFNAQ